LDDTMTPPATDRRYRYWTDMTTTEFAALDPERCLAVLPVAATEQHGPHLAVSTDIVVNEALLAAALGRLPAGAEAVVLPLQPVGVSPEHGDFAGTLSLSHETLIRVLIEIARGVAAAGLRKLVLFNSHGGQSHVMDIAAQKIRRKHRILVFPVNAYRFWDTAGAFGAAEAAHGIHAGAAETSIMLSAAPGRVRREAIAAHLSLSQHMERHYRRLRPYGRTGSFAWQMQDLSATGAVGDATLATAEAGAALIEEAGTAIAELFADMATLPSAEILEP
jgi:creatinine amidohydrolase